MYSNFTNSFKKLFVLMMISLVWATSGFAQTYTIGTGTGTNTGYTYPAPYGNWYNGAKHQFLILASELTGAGVTTQRMIQNLAFQVATVQGVALTNFTIKMGNIIVNNIPYRVNAGLYHFGIYGSFRLEYTYIEYSFRLGWNIKFSY